MLILLKNTLKSAPRLKVKNDSIKILDTSLSVIIPTYNEEFNIETCLLSVLGNDNPCKHWEVIVADDSSDDNTIRIARSIKNEREEEKTRLKIINAGERPKDESWVGKNWPCWRGVEEAKGNWLLFLDADVELKQDTLKRSLEESYNQEIDLLSLAPRITCSCFTEWVVQPIIATLLTIGFPINETNSPDSSKAFAAGPFMLFNKSTYISIGGHRNVSREVVEDIALANSIKRSGYKLRFILGLDALNVRMYKNFESLWEGWSKNWFLGLDKNIPKSLAASFIVFWVFTIPLIVILIATYQILSSNSDEGILVISLIFCLMSILLQFTLRRWCYKEFSLPMKYWYLMSIGGVIVGCIGPASVWKTITGYGWTWKGRPLA